MEYGAKTFRVLRFSSGTWVLGWLAGLAGWAGLELDGACLPGYVVHCCRGTRVSRYLPTLACSP